MPLSIENVPEFVVVQVRTDDPPESTLVGLADSVQDGASGGGTVFTPIVAAHVTEPPGPTAVPV